LLSRQKSATLQFATQKGGQKHSLVLFMLAENTCQESDQPFLWLFLDFFTQEKLLGGHFECCPSIELDVFQIDELNRKL